MTAHATACAAAFGFVGWFCGALPAALFAIAALACALAKALRGQDATKGAGAQSTMTGRSRPKPIEGPTGARPVY